MGEVGEVGRVCEVCVCERARHHGDRQPRRETGHSPLACETGGGDGTSTTGKDGCLSDTFCDTGRAS